MVAEKMAALDVTQLGHIVMLSGMPSAESGVLCAESAKHDQASHSQNDALKAAFNSIQLVEKALRCGGFRAHPAGNSRS